MAISYYIGWGMHVGVSLPNQLSREACWEFLCGDLPVVATLRNMTPREIPSMTCSYESTCMMATNYFTFIILR